MDLQVIDFDSLLGNDRSIVDPGDSVGCRLL